MDFSKVKSFTIPQGTVIKITNSNNVVLWDASKITDYRELEYIHFSGVDEYVDINYVPTPQTAWYLDCKFTGDLSETRYNGKGYMSARNRFGIGYNANNWFFGLGSWVTDGSSDANRHTFAIWNDQQTISVSGQSVTGPAYMIDGVATTGIGSTFVTGVGSIYIGANNSDNGAVNFISEDVYESQIKEGSTLIRLLRPAQRKSDNVCGLYDLVNNVFYPITGTTTTTGAAGPTLNENPDWNLAGYTPYRELEYIHFNGDEYIEKTDLTNKYGYQTITQFDLERNDVNQEIIGVWDDSQTNNNQKRYYMTALEPTNGIRAVLGNTYSTAEPLSNMPLNTKIQLLTEVTHNSNQNTDSFAVAYYNMAISRDIYQSGVVTRTGDLVTSAYPCLMARRGLNSDGTLGGITRKVKGKLYYYQKRTIYGNAGYATEGYIVNKQYPAQRKIDGVCGLYDTLTHTFYPMQGTVITSQAAGPVVNENPDWTFTQSNSTPNNLQAVSKAIRTTQTKTIIDEVKESGEE